MKSSTVRTTLSRKPGTRREPAWLPGAEAGTGVPMAPGRIIDVDPEQRRAMIAEAAYYRAAQRGFEPGRELEDWCAAESDIDARMGSAGEPTPCGT